MANYRRRTPDHPSFTKPPEGDSWSARYGERHRLRWITDFPAGISPPKKPRIYARSGHFIVQWWDPAAKGNLCERVNGDLADALAVARDVDGRLENFRASGRVRRRLKHRELVDRFTVDLRRRADAGEIAAATVDRYVSALAHYLACTEMVEMRKSYRYAVNVDRQFALSFAAFLENRAVAPNGHASTKKRPMRGQGFVLDAMRSLFEWAADPQRGNCLPQGFVNPFRRSALKRRQPVADPIGEPDITVAMAVDFMNACDDYQLRLFGPMLLYGLRAAEPVFLFREHVQNGWMRIGCIPELGYTTKGLRDKRVPLLDDVAALWRIKQSPDEGLVYTRRRVAQGEESPALLGVGLEELIAEFERRRQAAKPPSANARQRIRNDIVRDAGGLTYDQIDGEFRSVAKQMGWTGAATLKDFRHLFCTCLANGGMPEHERRFLMSHAPGRGAINVYTHLNEIAERYRAIVQDQWGDVLGIIRRRTGAGARAGHR